MKQPASANAFVRLITAKFAHQMERAAPLAPTATRIQAQPVSSAILKTVRLASKTISVRSARADIRLTAQPVSAMSCARLPIVPSVLQTERPACSVAKERGIL